MPRPLIEHHRKPRERGETEALALLPVTSRSAPSQTRVGEVEIP